jgi:thioredoxin 1
LTVSNAIEKCDNNIEEPAPKPETLPLVKDTTDSDFEQAIRSSRVVLVDCWAPWCGPCRMLIPLIDALARDYSGWAAFYKLNTDVNLKIVAQYQIYSIPTLLIFAKGNLADTIVGAVPRQYIECKLLDNINKI